MSSATVQCKCPVCVRDDYTMALELFNNWIWFHTTVFKWTPEIKKQYIKDLKTVQSLLPAPLIALVKEDNKKLAKFGEKLGWKKEDEMILTDGSKAYIYIWSN